MHASVPGPTQASIHVNLAAIFVSLELSRSTWLITPSYSVRPEGANHQWRKISPGELSIASVADERFGRVTDLVEAS